MSKERRVHPNPFRTRKLSASSPMILRIFAWESRSTPRYIPQPRQESCRGCCVLGRTENAKKTRFICCRKPPCPPGSAPSPPRKPVRERKGRKPSPQSESAPALQAGNMKGAVLLSGAFFWLNENPQLGWGFKKAFSFTYIVKTPFDLLALSCGLATAVNNKSKGGHYG